MGADVFVAMLSRDAKVEELSQLVSSEEDLQFYDDYDEIAHKITHRKQNKPKGTLKILDVKVYIFVSEGSWEN